ncbi:Na-translocating system protein MpsC family protein [Peribacillus sp. SCS-37]|uniref:Na-translocating system protein MpsC family protein n=1 Tax=Paraperibacillus esterisolvens TaxID=3115296 RepID=UPI003906AD3E
MEIQVEVKEKEKALSSFIARLLREHFGKGPGVVFASISKPYITIYLKDFLTPIENRLMLKNHPTYIQKLRDVLMETLTEEIKNYITTVIGFKVEEFYYDWNLESQSGMFIGIEGKAGGEGGSYQNQDKVHQEIILISEEAEKKPVSITSHLLNPRTLLVVRNGILVSIEKELIALNFQETLILAKRNLEKRLIHNHSKNLEDFLQAALENVFVAWDFQRDKSAAVFILAPTKYRQK